MRAVALAATLATIAAWPVGASAADNIGVTAAAQNQVVGVQSGTTRALAAGSQVFQDEMIRTGEQSTAQLLFLDETSLSIGPLSEVTLDRFVFNPTTGAGDVVLSATKGAFRFITGSQNPANYQLNTPFAAIGVRGTIVDCYAAAAGILCTAQEGTVILVVNGVEYVLGPGEALYVAANGEVTGPFTPDGEFFAVVGIPPYPLFGAYLPGDLEHLDVTDGSTERLDELFDQCTGEGCYEPCPDCDGGDL
jgi:hypothetical protein